MVSINESVARVLRARLARRDVSTIVANYDLETICPLCKTEKLIYSSENPERMVCINCQTDFDIDKLLKEADMGILTLDDDALPLIAFVDNTQP